MQLNKVAWFLDSVKAFLLTPYHYVMFKWDDYLFEQAIKKHKALVAEHGIDYHTKGIESPDFRLRASRFDRCAIVFIDLCKFLNIDYHSTQWSKNVITAARQESTIVPYDIWVFTRRLQEEKCTPQQTVFQMLMEEPEINKRVWDRFRHDHKEYLTFQSYLTMRNGKLDVFFPDHFPKDKEV